LRRYHDNLFFKVSPLESDVLLTTLHPLLENMLQTICHKLQEDGEAGGFDLRAPFFTIGKTQKSHRAISGLYGRRSNGVPPISVSASIATFQLCNTDAPLRLLCHPKKGSFKMTITPFSRSGWGNVRSALLAKGGTSKKETIITPPKSSDSE
jgi:hypothetical protein